MLHLSTHSILHSHTTRAPHSHPLFHISGKNKDHLAHCSSLITSLLPQVVTIPLNSIVFFNSSFFLNSHEAKPLRKGAENQTGFFRNAKSVSLDHVKYYLSSLQPLYLSLFHVFTFLPLLCSPYNAHGLFKEAITVIDAS